MARIRSIKPDFWTDEKVVELSAFARLLFIGLWNFADDEGRMVYSSKKIKMQIFPSDNANISELFGEIRRQGLIIVYAVEGVEYLQIKKFSQHQKIDKRTASKLPPPSSAELHRIPTTEVEVDREVEGNGEKNLLGDESPVLQNSTPDLFEDAWALYPHRNGNNPKRDAKSAWNARLKSGTDPELLLERTKRYAIWCEATGKLNTEHVMRASTFFGPGEPFKQSWDLPTIRSKADRIEAGNQRALDEWIENSEEIDD